MSKQILFLLIMVLVVGCASYPRISPDTEIQTIYELPNMDKNTIYENTLLWMAETFRSSNRIIELNDRDRGMIIANGVVNFNHNAIVYPCSFTMITEMKDNKIRITYKKLVLQRMYASSYEVATDQYPALKLKLDSLSSELYRYLKPEGSKKSDNDDW